MLHLRSDASFEVEANVFQAGSAGYKRGAYLQSISHRHTSVPRTVAALIALLWIHIACACVCAGINESLLVGFMNLFSCLFLSLSLSVAGPDRPLSSHMTTHTLGSSTTPTGNTLSAFSSSSPQRRLTVLRTGRGEVTFLVLHFLHSPPLPSALRAQQIMAPPESSPRHQKHFD